MSRNSAALKLAAAPAARQKSTSPAPADESLVNLRRNLMAAGSDKKARGRAVNAALLEIAALAPEHQERIEGCAKDVRREYKRTDRSDHSRVCYSLEHGATTLDELNEETGIPYNDLETVLSQLKMIGRVEERSTRDGHHLSGRGGTVKYYFLVNSAAFAEVIGKPQEEE
jgi:predicted Rossmann fold nucleotide-binding protein DprA/Smf involved in DNA uptake